MKLKETFATRKTYANKPRPLANPSLRKALELFDEVTKTQAIWDELLASIEHDRKTTYRGNWNKDRAIGTAYANAVTLIRRDLKRAFEKL